MHTIEPSLNNIKSKESIFLIRAQYVMVNATRNTNNVDTDNIVSSDLCKTRGLQKKLQIFNGARVMLCLNINVEQGLVNDAMGTITDIVWPLFGRDQMYYTDIPSVRNDFNKDGIHLIKPKSIVSSISKY